MYSTRGAAESSDSSRTRSRLPCSRGWSSPDGSTETARHDLEISPAASRCRQKKTPGLRGDKAEIECAVSRLAVFPALQFSTVRQTRPLASIGAGQALHRHRHGRHSAQPQRREFRPIPSQTQRREFRPIPPLPDEPTTPRGEWSHQSNHPNPQHHQTDVITPITGGGAPNHL